jgi:hypothetical protein
MLVRPITMNPKSEVRIKKSALSRQGEGEMVSASGQDQAAGFEVVQGSNVRMHRGNLSLREKRESTSNFQPCITRKIIIYEAVEIGEIVVYIIGLLIALYKINPAQSYPIVPMRGRKSKKLGESFKTPLNQGKSR